MSRQMTEKEKRWLKRLNRVLKDIPSTCELFGGGDLVLVDGFLQGIYDEYCAGGPEFYYQPIGRTIAKCSGGDPWCGLEEFYECDDCERKNCNPNICRKKFLSDREMSE